MRKHFFVLCSTILILSTAAQPPADPRLKGLDTFALKVLKDWHAPGVSIAVVEKGKVIYTGGFGYRDYEKKLPVTDNTLFAIGSCTKAFTASILGMLVKEGKVDLDKPVRNYLPQLKFKNEYTNDHATLRDMLCHRTGLPRHDASWYGSTSSRGELLQRIQYLEPSAELREKYQYNNFMFMALGVLIEEITGKSWEENMKERILAPLGMNNTVLSVNDMEKSSDCSLAYTLKKDSVISVIPYRNIDAIGPAGSVNSCAKDMANWLITWVNNGKFMGKEIIPSSFRNQAITQQMVTGGDLPDTENPDIYFSGYGLAWGMSSYRGHYRVVHGGGIDGFISSTCFFPSDSIGIFVVSDQGSPTAAIRNFIADRMLKLTYRNWEKYLLDNNAEAKKVAKQKINNDSLNRVQGTKPSHPINDYTGVYENPGYGQAKIFLQNDTLWTDYNDAGRKTTSFLQHYHYDVFTIRSFDEEEANYNAMKVLFNTNEKGKISSMQAQLEPAVKEIVFEKLPPAFDVEKTDLEKYAGEYILGPQTIRFEIRGNNTLWGIIAGQPEYEMAAIGMDEFKFKILSGFSVKFTVNDNGEVTDAVFIQPNGTFKATKKK